MKKLFVLKFLLLNLITFILLFALLPSISNKANASNIIFQDNFDDGVANEWASTLGPPDLWQVKNINGNLMYGARIDSGNTIIDSVAANVATSNYQIDFDYLPIMGLVNTNLDFRFSRNSPSEIYSPYEVHFTTETNFWTNFGYLGLAPGQTILSSTPLLTNQINNIKIILDNQHIQFFINGTKILDYIDTAYHFTGDEKIGLRISTGATYPTEVWFDNIVVTSLDEAPTPLTVPYFGQNDSPWGSTEYDHASGKLSNPTMNRWGCVVASAAMVLRYHNINEFADGAPINPGSLNEWLKNNKGYLTGYNNMDGFYSYFNWPVIGTLTKQLFNARKSNIKLMHKRAYPSNNTTTILNEDLNKFPDILGVNNSQTSSHFVVAKGRSGNTYSINDPEWNYPTLTSFNNNYSQVDRYILSQTNLSYLLAVVNPGVELLITDTQNYRTGKYFNNGQLQQFDTINNAYYSFQPPISNPNSQGVPENLGTGVNEFLLPEPENGKYTIKLSSKKSGFYEINIASFEEEGNNALNKIRGVISSNNDEIIEIDYSQSQTSEIKRTVSFQSLINDINEAKNLNLIKPWVANNLIKLTKSSQKNYDKGRKKIAVIELNVFENIIKSIRKTPLIKEDAYQILLYDVRYLKRHL